LISDYLTLKSLIITADDIFEALSNNTLFGDEGCSLENSTCTVAIFEIYGGRIQDLLNNRNRLKVLEDGKGEVVVSGLEEFEATNPKEFLAMIEKGHNHRTTHATEANDVSSRSHAICQIMFRDRTNGGLKGKLSLVDLAGSER
jgi:kinesin family protein 2/24